MGNQLTKMPTSEGMPSSAGDTAVSTLCAFSIGHRVVSLAGHGGGEGLAVGQLALDLVALEGDLADLVLRPPAR